MANTYKSTLAVFCISVAGGAVAQSGSPTGICHYRTGGTGPCLPESSPSTSTTPNVDYGIFRQFGEALGKKLFDGSGSNHSLSVQFNKQGIELYNQKRYDEAVQAFMQALRYEPGDATVEGNLGKARAQSFNESGITFLNAGNPAAAIESFSQALQLWPDNTVMQQNLALARQSLNEKSLHDEALALSRKGDAELAAGHTAAAVDMYQRAFEKDPQQWIRKNLDNASAMLAAERASAERDERERDELLRSKLNDDPVISDDLRDEKIEALIQDREVARQNFKVADQDVANLSASGEQQVTLAFAKQHREAAMQRVIEDNTAIQEELDHERALRKQVNVEDDLRDAPANVKSKKKRTPPQQHASAPAKSTKAPKIEEILSKECPHPPIPEGNNTFFYQCNKQDRVATPYCLEKKNGWIREVACH